MGFGGMGLGWIVPLVLIGIVVWVVVTVVRSQAGHGDGTGGTPDRSLEILKERFARGELDEDTYRRMRGELEHRP